MTAQARLRLPRIPSFPRTRAGLAKLLAAMILLLYAGSFATLGYVGPISNIAEWYASLSVSVKVCMLIAAIGAALLLVWYAGWVKALALSGSASGAWAAVKYVGLAVLVAGVVAGVVMQVNTLDKSPYAIEVIRLSKPINTSTARLVPLHTAYAYAVSMLQTPTHTIYEDETYVYYMNNSVIYNWIIEPEGFWNSIKYPPQGVILVNGTVYPPKVVIINRTLAWGLHSIELTSFYMNNLYREIKLRVGFEKRVLMECNTEVIYGNRVYIIIPIARWETGMFTSVPVVDGYAVVSEDGNIEILSASQARSDPRFKNIPLVPDVVAREWVEVYKWYTGVGEVILRHNTYEIRDVGRNPQPYLMRGDDGRLYWVFIVEPPGQTYAARYIFYVDTCNTRPHIMIYTLPEPVIGISRVESLIMNQHPTYDWSQFEIAEPMPIIINGKLYWKVTVITRDGRGLRSVDLVDTETNQVISITSSGELTMSAVLSSIEIREIAGGNETAPTSLQDILNRIEEIKDRIREYQSELDKLYQELDELQRAIEEYYMSQSNQTKT